MRGKLEINYEVNISTFYFAESSYEKKECKRLTGGIMGTIMEYFEYLKTIQAGSSFDILWYLSLISHDYFMVYR